MWLQSKDASKTILRIDAVFVEDFHRTVHPSDGSVENAECQEIENQIDSVEAEKKQSQEREKQHQDKLAAQELETQALIGGNLRHRRGSNLSSNPGPASRALAASGGTGGESSGRSAEVCPLP